ncbi:Mg-protoporphyrin IX chelatase BchO 30 kDa subunit [Sulfitobacter noctilucicola]|uniref:Magnesium chelatase accessory protein n=1 Tax=Sulfitobacter noctilucicola TaxID=1342301 RepID=A0A7W6Q676_9RHOB|nr:alpha/beta fold hydrolase BchO [Sulfitobacter noctilucicola]KIN70051.1 Mg-protoporphyrin IX chelatase BchO 30 kDa subunit [Sulfitobacter noctilucicola]MBB4176064.1 magnesium chelatase accessory protein [Sulfitobacter noctilucicola]
MDWDKHSGHWPHAQHSKFILCKPHRWHVQEMGEGPLLLLLHGAGGGVQSWRHLMPLLAKNYRVIAMDLPGQGFTKCGAQQRLGLIPIAQDISKLCADQEWVPAAIIGHSAGGALALQMAQDMTPAPPVIGINAALGNFKGLAGLLFPLIAKALAMTPMVARFFTASTSRSGSIKRLIEGTGSTLPDEDLIWYQALIGDAGHVDGTLGMMAQWNLDPLLRKLHQHPSETLLIVGDRDKAVPPSTSLECAGIMPAAEVVTLPELGHLAHEEDAGTVLTPILAFLQQKIR